MPLLRSQGHQLPAEVDWSKTMEADAQEFKLRLQTFSKQEMGSGARKRYGTDTATGVVSWILAGYYQR